MQRMAACTDCNEPVKYTGAGSEQLHDAMAGCGVCGQSVAPGDLSMAAWIRCRHRW